jgi:hypothetical protein
MSTWHAAPAALTEFAIRPHRLDDATAASIEVHLLVCDLCRATVADAADADDADGLSASWNAVADRIDRPAASGVEKLLRRLGVSDTYARLVGATRSLQLAWLAALVAVVGLAVLVARGSDKDDVFLVVAPLVPIAAVAIAFALGGEPAGEAAAAAPVSGAGLVLRRAVAVLGASLLALTLGAVALPDVGLVGAAWVLPALGLTLASVALATWVRIDVAASVLGGAWLCVLWMSALSHRTGTSPLERAPFNATGQVVFALLIAFAVAVLAVRRDAFATLGRQT